MTTHRLRDTDALPPPECFTIDEFCMAHRVSRSTYYRLREEERGPGEFHLGDKVLITRESAQRWRAARDAEAKTSHEKATLMETHADRHHRYNQMMREQNA